MYQNPDSRRIGANLVVTFHDGVVCSQIRYDSTLADISKSVARFGKWHEGAPLLVKICFDLPKGRLPQSRMPRKALARLMGIRAPRLGLQNAKILDHVLV